MVCCTFLSVRDKRCAFFVPEKEDAMTREDCLLALREAADRLGRLPKKGDFDDHTVMMVKSLVQRGLFTERGSCSII